MSDIALYSAVGLAAYLVALVLLTLQSSRKESAAAFMIGERRVGVISTLAAIAGNLRDGAGLAAWVSLGYFYGYGALWLTAGLAAALALIAIVAPRVRREAGAQDYITLTQLIVKKVGPKTGRLAVFIISATALLYASAQVYVAGRLFASLFGASFPIGIIITVVVVATYLAVGGYQATIMTSLVQAGIIMLIVVLPIILIGGVPSVAPETLVSPGIQMAVAFFGISFLFVLCSADLWQLVFSASSPRTARRSFLFSIPLYFLICIGLVFFSSAVRTVVGQDVSPENAFFALFSNPTISPFLISVLGVFVLAAVMSVLDSQVFLFTSTISREKLPTEVRSESPALRTLTRSSVFVTMIVLALIAATIGDIVQFLFSAVTLVTVLAPVLILSLLARQKYTTRQDLAVVISLAISIICYAYMFYSGAFGNLVYTLVPAVVSTVLCFISVLVGGFYSPKLRGQ